VSVRASQVALVVKNLFAYTGNIRDMGSILGGGTKILRATQLGQKKKKI